METITLPQEFINHFVNRLIRNVDIVDRIVFDLQPGWFCLKAEGTKKIGGLMKVDYLISANFDIELIHYTGSEQIIKFTQRGETKVEGREYFDDILTNFAGDPIRSLVAGWNFVSIEEDSFIFRLGDTPVGSFFGSDMLDAPVTELLPIHELRLEEDVLALKLVCM